VTVNTTVGDVSGLNVLLKGGDADNDNVVSVDDLSLFIQAFDADPSSSNWNENADFNCNDLVDVDDLSIFIRNFDMEGDA
jgi:hypothetical protein